MSVKKNSKFEDVSTDELWRQVLIEAQSAIPLVTAAATVITIVYGFQILVAFVGFVSGLLGVTL